jgi:hypothetical protein
MNRWISTKNKFPEKRKYVLITVNSCWVESEITIAEYICRNRWSTIEDYHISSDDVLAWMPLPTPYQEGPLSNDEFEEGGDECNDIQ